MSEQDNIQHLNFNYQGQGTETIGPFSSGDYYRVVVDGYEVPYITANLVPGTEDTWSLTLDRRFSIDVSGDELRRWGWFLVNAMAVAAGYSCHGKNCRPKNPFMLQVMEIGKPEEETK